MKELYLVRHAKSSWDHPELSDFERPLNGRGRRDSPEMGRRLARRGIVPDLMLSSPANRAMTTCRTIAGATSYDEYRIQTDQAIYHADAETLLKVIRKLPDAFRRVMLFGHNPGFTDLANALTGADLYNIPTCGVFACGFDTASWRTVRFGQGKQLFYDYPKKSPEAYG